MQKEQLSTIFSKNRAEELPNDIWNKYVLPLNYEQSNLLNFSKSTIVKGGRGSGKTMFLKYHCYPTIFSKNKKELLKSELTDIGVYWRPDTDFANMITKNYLDKNWKVAFDAYIGLSIFSEFSKLITTFIASNYKDKNHINSAKTLMIPDDFKMLFDLEEICTVSSFDKVCQKYRSLLNDWLNYPEGEPPIIFGAKEKLLYFINTVLKSIEPFKSTTFHIFIDEFENLSNEQQILINSWIKHSSDPLIFHIAYKKHYKVTSDTESDEKIVDVNDYRIIDLEKLYEDNFEILASEIILSKLYSYFDEEQVYNLSDIKIIENRRDDNYQNKIKDIVKKIFPSLSISELVIELFKDKALVSKLKKLIEDGLKSKKSNLDYKLFVDINKKEESLINGILLNRKSINPDELLKHFEDKNKIYYKDYINNNLLGSILLLYTSYQNKTCPYYAGFERFIVLSQDNIRHLLELCHQSIIEYERIENFKQITIENFSIPLAVQTKAVRNTSKTQIDKIANLGRYGKDLQKIVIRLGKIFLLSQKRNSQSMSEVNQFTIKGYEIHASDEDGERLINECKIWGILKEEDNNKQTTDKDNARYLYILHPIFAPYFGISYRKKRKIDLSYEEFKNIFIDKEEEYQKLYSQYSNQWSVSVATKDSIYNTNSLLDFI